jgi:hypothetical protein
MDEKRKIQTDLAFIIEDDRDIANMYAQVVREGGFQVEVFYGNPSLPRRTCPGSPSGSGRSSRGSFERDRR